MTTPLVAVEPEYEVVLHVPVCVAVRLSWMQLRASGLHLPSTRDSETRARPAEPLLDPPPR